MSDKSERYVTSEEKLLKLIRRKDPSQKAKAAQAVPFPVKGLSLGGASSEDLLAVLNKMLMAVVAGLAVYLIVKAAFLTPGPAAVGPVKELAVSVITDNGSVGAQPKPLDYYLGAVEKRDMFDTSFSPAPAAPDLKAAAVSSDDPRQELRLVGIVMDSNPQAIIEDLRSHETYFLSSGQQVRQFTVDTIKEEKVILSNNGKMYELSNE